MIICQILLNIATAHTQIYPAPFIFIIKFMIALSASIRNSIENNDFARLELIVQSPQFKKNLEQLIKKLPIDIITQSRSFGFSVQLRAYDCQNLEMGLIKFLNFLMDTFGKESLFAYDNTGRNFLNYAICKDFSKVLAEFYTGNKINEMTGEDYLMEAASFNSHRCIQWLCQHGESLWARNKSKQSALDIAILNKASLAEKAIRKHLERHEKMLSVYRAYCNQGNKTELGRMLNRRSQEHIQEILRMMMLSRKKEKNISWADLG